MDLGRFSKYFKGDRVIWAVVIILSVFSLLAVYSATGTLAYKTQGGNTAYFIGKHAFFLLLGIATIYLVHLIPYKIYFNLSMLFLLISVILLAVTLSMGTSLNEASRWITLPIVGYTIQTSDIAKLALIMYIARVLSLKHDKISKFKDVVMHLVLPIVVVCGLIMPANLSTALLLFATSLVLMFIGRVPMKYLMGFSGIVVLFIILVIGGIAVSGNKWRVETWQNRIVNYMDKDGGENYQVEQSKIAIATGGVIGKGPGNSTQRNFLPHPYSDFIYAIIIEEYGLIGGISFLFLYLFLLYRAGLILRKSTRTFPAFLVIGLALNVTFQAMINMGVAVNLLPVTGQTLPWVSMGGTSIMFTAIAIGIMLSISRTVNKNAQKQVAES